jgi:hypothetical protein
MRLETAMLAEHEAPRKVFELKSLRRRRIERNYQLLLKVKPEAAARFAAYEASRKGKSDDRRGT